MCGTRRTQIGADDKDIATTEGLCALGDQAIDSNIEGLKWPPERAEKAVVDAVFISPEPADLISVVDAACLCRDRTIKERRGNFSKLQRVAIKVNNKTVLVEGAISLESGSLI